MLCLGSPTSLGVWLGLALQVLLGLLLARWTIRKAIEKIGRALALAAAICL